MDPQSQHPRFQPSTFPTIVHTEPEWLVLDKPIGWHTVAARDTDGAPTIEQWIAKTLPQQCALPECGLVHRLDRSTSGCLLVARDQSMYDSLRENFSVGRGGWSIEKKYLALVTPGLPSVGEFDLYFSGRHKGSAKVQVKPHGSASERGACRWKVVRRAAAGSSPSDPRAFDLVEVDLIGAGRRHQIRAGLSSLGHPLAGDDQYRGTALDPTWNSNCSALHAWRLCVSGVLVTCPKPIWAECGQSELPITRNS